MRAAREATLAAMAASAVCKSAMTSLRWINVVDDARGQCLQLGEGREGGEKEEQDERAE